MKGRGGVLCKARHVGTKNQIVWLPSAGKPKKGAGRVRRAYYQIIRDLGEQSRVMGWFNGVRLGKHK